ncbi:MAG: YbaK/EbsC family protein [Desulfobacteraceae bacterium]|nr:MAG: YbaK/EbsC family protein [Desulfobacteraceae bacterium]
MAAELSPSAQRVQEALKGRGFSCKVVELPASTRTAQEAARAVGCDVSRIAKSLVFMGKQTGEPYLVIASGINRVDEAKLSRRAGEPVVKADAEFVRRHTGFSIGGVPPAGHIKPIKTWVDQALLESEIIWAAAGTPHAVFELRSSELQEMTGGSIVAVDE